MWKHGNYYQNRGGYSVGYDDGHSDGYNQGYSAGHNAAQKILLANALVDVPDGWKLVNYPSGNGPVTSGGTKIPIVTYVGGTWGTNTGSDEVLKGYINYKGGSKTIISIGVNQACQGYFHSSPIIYVPQYFSTMQELLSVTRVGINSYGVYLGSYWTLEKQ